jgi:tubulin polyglutamylase TTLL9
MWADKEWMREFFDQMHLMDNQKVNHFRNHFEVMLLINNLRNQLTRKDNLMKNLKRTKRQLEKEEKWQEAAKYRPLFFILI